MAFDPNIRDRFVIEGVTYEMAEHPAAKGVAYGQTGRMATAYQLVNVSEPGDRYALKVIKEKWRAPALVTLSQKLEPFAELPGLTVCRRVALNARQHSDLLRQHPDLLYASLMPWISGPTWMQIIQEKRELTPKHSLALARALAEILTTLEERGVAHCDLSGPNLIIANLPDNSKSGEACAIALVDVEQLFGPGLNTPPMLSSGSPGYAKKDSPKGIWSTDGDRFAGAILLAEMLGFCDAVVREAAVGESYFTPEEIQRDSAKLAILRSSLQRHWGEGVLNLFNRVWASETLANCPTMGEWLITLPLTASEVGTEIAPALLVQPEQPRPRAADVIEDKPRAPLAPPVPASSSGSPLMGWRQLDGSVNPPPPPMPAPIPATGPAPTPKPDMVPASRSPAPDPISTAAPMVDRGLATGEWKPQIPKVDRTQIIVSTVGVIIAFGVGLFIVAQVFGQPIQSAYQSVLSAFGNTGGVVVNTALMAALTGAAQLWVFRNRVKGFNRLWFGLATILGGVIGGLVGQMAMGTRTSLVGVIYGLVGGAAASLGQNVLMRSSDLRAKWLGWNVVGWGIIWLIGWTISWGLGGTIIGVAASAAFMMIATGLLLGLFLKTYPDVEF